MILYHGSTAIVDAPLVNAGRSNLDFGRGFYLTRLAEQATSWATRPTNTGKPHYLCTYELDLDAVLAAGFRYRAFEQYDEQWLDFIVANRRGGDEWMRYDIIEGGVANDRVFNTVELYAAGLTPREEALKRLRYESPNNQVCILNQDIIDRFLLYTGFTILP